MKYLRLLIAVPLLLATFSCSERIVEPQAVKTPTFAPESGSYPPGQVISISCATLDAIKYFTLDGSEPTSSSTRYTGFLTLGSGALNADSVFIKTIAYKDGMNPSTVASAWYVIDYLNDVAAPTIFPLVTDITTSSLISIICSTDLVQIRYTLDGSVPTQSSTQYTAPFTLPEAGEITLRARGFRAGWNPSEVSTTVFYVNEIVIPADFRSVTGGSFNNGSSTVTVGSFHMASHEVTQAEYQSVMGSNPSLFADPAKPVDNLTWFDAVKYCNLRSMAEGLHPAYSYLTHGTNPANWPADWNSAAANHVNITCNWHSYGYRLPTEMEYMFAAKGGTETMGYLYSGSNDLAAVAWFADNSGSSTHATGTKAANELDLFDLSGNADEWVWDIFGSLPTTGQYNPHGPDSGNARTRRGGSWNSAASDCSLLSGRSGQGPLATNSKTGFRVVRRGG